MRANSPASSYHPVTLSVVVREHVSPMAQGVLRVLMETRAGSWHVQAALPLRTHIQGISQYAVRQVQVYVQTAEDRGMHSLNLHLEYQCSC